MKLAWNNPDLPEAFSLRRWLRLNILLLALTALVSVSFPVLSLSHWVGDSYFRLRGIQPTSPDVALVLIDDAALSQYGRWPWPRTRLAQLLEAVHNSHPRAIGIDVLLPERENENDDMALETAIQQAGNVVLPAKISSSLEGALWTEPLPRFAKAAVAIGHAQAVLDSDGVCRKIPTQEPGADGPRPAFALALAGLATKPVGTQHSETDTGQISGIERIAPSEYLTINYRQQFSPAQAIPPFITLSARDLLQAGNSKALEGKIVLIGFGATELSDRLFTPVSGQEPMPGVEVNANALATLLEHREIKSPAVGLQVLFLVVAGIVSLWLVIRWPGLRGLFGLAAFLLCEYLAGYLVFNGLHRQLEYGPFLVAGMLAAPLAQLENLFVVDQTISRRLKALEVLLPASTELAPDKVVVPNRESSASPLHWKLRALQRLEDELASLYSFDETLLETMQEALAVYAFDGRLLFHNSSWKTFCEKQSLQPASSLENLAQSAGLGNDLSNLSPQPGAWIEREVSLKESLWRFRAIRLPWPSAAEPSAIMLLAEDISARRERDQARAEALGFVTHELRTPLIAIQGFAELLMRYPQQAAGSDAPSVIFRESRRLVAMINAYLEVLRMDVGSRPIRLKPVMISDMVQHVQQILQPLAQSARIEISTRVSPADQVLNCDESLVTGALLNLVSNAVKYSPNDSTVTLEARAHDSEVEFQVRNPGPVIPAEDLERVFEPFYRAEAHSKTAPGWGLGLAFVKRISEQHGGRIQVSSGVSSGTCFCLTLPIGSSIASEAVV